MMKDLKLVLNDIQHNVHTGSQEYLVRLIDYIRPHDPGAAMLAEERIRELIVLLNQDEDHRKAFSEYVVRLIVSKNHIRLLTELGISANAGFFSELLRRFNEKILPPLIDKNELLDLLEDLFRRPNDYIWVEQVNDLVWAELFELIRFGTKKNLQIFDEFYIPVMASIPIIANRISALGLDRDLITRLPHLEKYNSSFLMLPQEVFNYIELVKNQVPEEVLQEHYRQLKVIIKQCQDQLNLIRKNQPKDGVSITVVYLLLRIQQNLERLNVLLGFTQPGDHKKEAVRFFKALVKAENKKHGIREHIRSNTNLLAYQIVEHTSQTGEHYISNTPKEYFKFLWKSMGGGLIIVFVTWIKFLISYVKFAPLTEGFWYSINYSLGFVGIYASGTTLATKQPAMTASALAGSLDSRKKEVDTDNAVELIIKMARSQFVSFFGNLIIVIPVGYLIAWFYYQYTGDYIVHEGKAMRVMVDNNAFTSMCIIYGAVTGVFLFLSGLISGYYDNKVDYNKIPQRIREHKGLKRYFPQGLIDRVSSYVDDHLGGIVGNVFLGFCLGLAPAIGAVTGLPLDVRHITLAGCSTAMSAFTLGDQVTGEMIFGVAMGVSGIGLMNFVVSFGLTLFVAVKSRKMNFTQTGELINKVFARLIVSPGEFFYPPVKRVVSLPDTNHQQK